MKMVWKCMIVVGVVGESFEERFYFEVSLDCEEDGLR